MTTADPIPADVRQLAAKTGLDMGELWMDDRIHEGMCRAIMAERARNAALVSEAVAGWQPIETAPKDWSDLILFDDSADTAVFPGYFSCKDGGSGGWISWADRRTVHPTHWQPLPTPPARTPTQEKPEGDHDE